MNKIYSLLLICLFLFPIAFLPTVAQAGNRPGALTVTLGGGYEYFSSKRRIQDSGVPFGILGYDFSDHWAFEGLLGMFITDFDNSVNDKRQIRGTLFLLDAVYRFTPYGAIEPYVLAGPGITGLDPNRNDANNEGNINAGIGAQLFPHKNVAFRVDARDLYTWVGGKNDVMLDIGASFLFDV